MKLSPSIVIAAAAASAIASASGCATLRGHKRGDDPNNPIGRCFGVVDKAQGDCGGRDPATGQSWSCSGENTTADLGWKKMSKDQCERTAKHQNATAKRFEPFES